MLFFLLFNKTLNTSSSSADTEDSDERTLHTFEMIPSPGKFKPNDYMVSCFGPFRDYIMVFINNNSKIYEIFMQL